MLNNILKNNKWEKINNKRINNWIINNKIIKLILKILINNFILLF